MHDNCRYMHTLLSRHVPYRKGKCTDAAASTLCTLVECACF